MEGYREDENTIKFLTQKIILQKENKELKEELKQQKEMVKMIQDRQFRVLLHRAMTK